MKKYQTVILIVYIVFQPLIAGQYAAEANDNPFLNGDLNSKYEGEASALAGEILEVRQTKQKFPIYKLNLNLDDINPVWVASIAAPPGGEIKKGDMIIFRGYIATTTSLDLSEELKIIIGSNTVLMAIQSQRAN